MTNDEQDASCSIQFKPDQNLPIGSTILNSDSVAINGTILFAQLNIRQTPETESEIQITFSTLELFGNEIEELTSPPPIEIKARACLEGEAYGATLTCTQCERGTKLYKAQDEPGSCLPCLDNEECFGTNMTAPKASFWRSSPTSENYLECFNRDACLEATKEFPLGKCEEGYGGFMCTNCVGRYRRGSAFECTECFNPVMNIFISFVYLLMLIAAVIILVRVTIKTSNEAKPLSTVYLKVFLNHFQILQVISKIRFGWPEEI